MCKKDIKFMKIKEVYNSKSMERHVERSFVLIKQEEICKKKILYAEKESNNELI